MNPSIRDPLVDMLGKPTADATALRVRTTQWGHPYVTCSAVCICESCA